MVTTSGILIFEMQTTVTGTTPLVSAVRPDEKSGEATYRRLADFLSSAGAGMANFTSFSGTLIDTYSGIAIAGGLGSSTYSMRVV